MVIILKVIREYERLKEQLKDVDEKQLALVDGSILEAARLKVELDELNLIIKETGLLKYNPKNLAQQKELPVSKMITKVRANYLSYITRLSSLLGKNLTLDEEDDLNEFE